MFTSIMSLMLLLSVCGSVIRPTQGTANGWLGMRSLYYFAGLLVSGYYINYMTTTGSNQRHFDTLRWNHFVPMIFCIVGLIHSAVVNATRPRVDGYSPQEDDGDIVFRDENTR